ncbi:MAG TPA: hypothetical protein VH601_17015 [Bryobacteraceae bacterium]|jgi:hypothetical protein
MAPSLHVDLSRSRSADVCEVLFTSCAEPFVWNDAMTGLESHSLGVEEYRRRLVELGLEVTGEYDDEGRNHYFDAFKVLRAELLT